MVTRRRSPTRSIPKSVVVVGVLMVVGALTYGLVRAAGWLGESAPLTKEPSREGLVPVPKSLVALRAFNAVDREDVYSRTLGDDSYFWLPKKTVDDHPEWITRYDDIIGRVMARDKRSDFVFSEKDFLPEGSRSGIAGGIAAGKQGFFLDAAKIPGLRFLKAGDRFDLLASEAEESESSASEYGLLMGGIKARGGKPVPLAGVRILVQNAEMIALTTNRNMTTQGGLKLDDVDSRGRSSGSGKDERVMISIDPAEAVPLTQALASNSDVYMVTRSGQESSPQNDADILAGRIALPASTSAIKAFEPVRGADLAEPSTGELRQYYFLPADLQDDWIAQPEKLIGRVVRRDIEPGYIFKESDFLSPGSLVAEVEAYQQLTAEHLVDGNLSVFVGRVAARDLHAGETIAETDLFPPGTPSGLTAAIPADRMALTIKIADVRGASELSRGDRCDLLASKKLDLNKAMNGVEISPALETEFQTNAINRVLATAVSVIATSDEQIVVVARPDEVSHLARALTQKVDVYCIGRAAESASDAANDESAISAPRTKHNGLVSDPDPLGEILVSETLIGGQRRARAYRRTP